MHFNSVFEIDLSNFLLLLEYGSERIHPNVMGPMDEIVLLFLTRHQITLLFTTRSPVVHEFLLHHAPDNRKTVKELVSVFICKAMRFY